MGDAHVAVASAVTAEVRVSQGSWGVGGREVAGMIYKVRETMPLELIPA
jgi:hypothetical protein